MSVCAILDFNVSQGPEGAFEPVKHETSAGVDIAFRDASVRFGGTDIGELFHVDTAGRIYQTEVGTEDDGVAIPFLAATKFFDLGAVSMLHSSYIRLVSAEDTATLTARVKGSEYGDIEREYTLDLSGTAGEEKEIKVRLHRTLLGRYAQLEISGSFANRPEIRDWTLLAIPVRSGRVSA